MKARWIAAVLLAFLLPISARSDTFLPIPFRDNDPFVFCTQGWSPFKVDMGWIPAPPYTTGLIIPLHPTWWWSPQDWSALWYYQVVCPGALVPGAWTGPEPPQVAPVFH